MKNFNESLFLNYEIGHTLNEEFVNGIYNLFKCLNDTEYYNDCNIVLVSIIKLSNGTQIITYGFYSNGEKKFDLIFKSKENSYELIFKNVQGIEVLKISAPKFTQILSLAIMCLPDLLLVA